MLRPASPGTGVIAGGAVRIVLEMAGVENALGKQLGSKNALNNARATVAAVQRMRQFRDDTCVLMRSDGDYMASDAVRSGFVRPFVTRCSCRVASASPSILEARVGDLLHHDELSHFLGEERRQRALGRGINPSPTPTPPNYFAAFSYSAHCFSAVVAIFPASATPTLLTFIPSLFPPMVLSRLSGDSVSVAVVPSSTASGDFRTVDALAVMWSFFNVDLTVTTHRLVEVRKNYFIPPEYELHIPLSGSVLMTLFCVASVCRPTLLKRD
ncbi:hypothetical protein BHM03_00046619 [Ensete ventricosum]|nr:hypothetical protein BHM03_00046619 [Ensete ventricosum]